MTSCNPLIHVTVAKKKGFTRKEADLRRALNLKYTHPIVDFLFCSQHSIHYKKKQYNILMVFTVWFIQRLNWVKAS